MVSQSGNAEMVMLANGSAAKKWITPRMYARSRYEAKPIGIVSTWPKNPSNPVKKESSIASGMKVRMRIFAGSETSESMPVSYIRIGSTVIVAARVVATVSRNWNFSGSHRTQSKAFGVMNSMPTVARNES